MSNPGTSLKAIFVYLLCLPLAIFIGYLLAGPATYSSLGTLGMLAALLIFPLLMRWHYPLLLFSWNMTFCVFFVKGAPDLWLVMVVMSMGMSFLERALSRNAAFIHVPQIFWPLVCLFMVVLVTARLTGGFGLHSFGSEVYGGKKYIYVLVAIIAYFAFTARPIPPEKVRLYISLYFLGGLTWAIGDLMPIMPASLDPIFWIFHPVSFLSLELESGVARFRGVSFAGFSLFAWLMALYGVRGTFFCGRKWWRLVLFFVGVFAVMLGGFRSAIAAMAMIFSILFFMEGLHRTRLLPAFGLLGLLGGALLIPLAPKLPYSMQRAVAFLPLDLDASVKLDAQGSTEWRLNMWDALLPQVPKHLLLGKGYAITQDDYEMMGFDTSFASFDPSQQGLALAGDYHNGPLSVILPFGIWGAIAFTWFMVSVFWVLYRNFRWGDESMRIINSLLLAIYIERLVSFFFIFGGLNVDLPAMVGYVGLSISLNGGVCRRHVLETTESVLENKPPASIPRPRPSFQR